MVVKIGISELIAWAGGRLDGESDLQTARERLLPLWEGLDPAADVDPALVSLYAGQFLDWLDRFSEGKAVRDNASYARLNILLAGGEVAPERLVPLSREPFLSRLAPRSLISAGERVADIDPIAARCYLAAASNNIRSPIQLNQALKLLQIIRLGPGALDGLTRTKVAVAGNCTLKPLADFLPLALMAHGVDAQVWEAPFDQWAGLMLNADSELYRFQPSFVVLYLSSLGLTQAGTKESFQETDLLGDCLASLAAKSSARVVIILPEPLEEEFDTSNRFYAWRQEALRRIRDLPGDRLIMVDPAPVITDLGRSEWYASRYWYHAKLPTHPSAMPSLGREVALTIARCISVPVKVVVCDLDNTLWGGIVGEDGWQNLKLDVHSSGGPFIRLQAFLKGLIDMGILLAVVSKNNEPDVREAFEKRSEMLLEWDDFTAVVANWQPKSENIAWLAKTLNLGLKNFCFLDDSPFERAEVRSSLPEVIVPELPADPEGYVPFLVDSGLFHVPLVTDEDKKRADMYRKEMARAESMKEVGDLESFLNKLGLEALSMDVGSENIERVVQLIHKTNQFNLTTRRHDYEKVRNFAANGEVFSQCYKVTDKFGDSGICGVLVAQPEGDEAYSIDTWILSCRVMGRTVERGVFEHLVSWLKERGVKKLIGHYYPTPKNKPVENLLDELGFVRIAREESGACTYEYDVSAGYEGNKFVKVT